MKPNELSELIQYCVLVLGAAGTIYGLGSKVIGGWLRVKERVDLERARQNSVGEAEIKRMNRVLTNLDSDMNRSIEMAFQRMAEVERQWSLFRDEIRENHRLNADILRQWKESIVEAREYAEQLKNKT